jgi:UDP-2,3-diacylglucosamine hydrolase
VSRPAGDGSGATPPSSSEWFAGRPADGAGLATFGLGFAALPRVSLGRVVWVVSDLHLPPEADARTERFVAWCDAVREEASGRSPFTRVVCLGDLFDVWVGRCQLALSGTAPVADALARLGAAGVAVDLLPGNRDTLLDAAFEQRAGVTLRRDGLVLIGADGRPRVLCLHGDELCIREPGYLRLRRTMRSRWFRALSRVAPLWFARAVGRRLRDRYSGARGPRQPERGPQRDAAFAAAWGAGAQLLLSGHSHAPADDVLAGAGLLPVLEEPPTVRWVTLGAFGDGADVVRLDAAGVPEVLSASP